MQELQPLQKEKWVDVEVRFPWDISLLLSSDSLLT